MNSPLEPTAPADPRGPDRPANSPGRVLIVGERRDRRRLALCLSRGPWAGWPVVGFVDAGHPREPRRPGLGAGRQFAVHPGSGPVPVLGGIDRLSELVGRARATHVVVAVSGPAAPRLRSQVDRLNRPGVAVHWVGDDAAALDPAAGRPASAPPAPLAPPIPWPIPWGRMAKRALDVFGASLGLMLLAPLFAVVAVAIYLTSGRPIFYLQERVGQGGRRFRIVKFRSMRTDAESQTGPVWATNHDARCTRIGDWLRNTNVDELPQLFNVLRGDMSLVGPRPERPMFVGRFREALPDYELRHAVPGGMTGWAQVHGYRGRTSLRKRVQYDLDYIERWSFGLDLRVLYMTVQHVLRGRTYWGPLRDGQRPPDPEPQEPWVQAPEGEPR